MKATIPARIREMTDIAKNHKATESQTDTPRLRKMTRLKRAKKTPKVKDVKVKVKRMRTIFSTTLILVMGSCNDSPYDNEQTKDKSKERK